MPKNSTIKYLRQKWIYLKEKGNESIIIAEDFNLSLPVIDRSEGTKQSRHVWSEEHQSTGSIYIYTMLQSATEEDTFFSSLHIKITEIDGILEKKSHTVAKLNEWKWSGSQTAVELN